MLQDKEMVILHMSRAHHGAINIKKYYEWSEAAPGKMRDICQFESEPEMTTMLDASEHFILLKQREL